MICVTGLVINLAILAALTELFGVYYIISALFGIAAATLWNYVMSAMWTWKYTLRDT